MEILFGLAILLGLATLPVILLGIYIYNKDRNKEPAKLLGKLFGGGVLSCFLVILVSLILGWIFPFFSSETEGMNLIELFIYVFIGVALVEEVCKWSMVYLFSYNDKHFDELYDMIVYSVFVALGFACLENILYTFANGMSTAIIRGLSAVPGHACDGAVMGYYLGMAKLTTLNNRKDLSKKYMLLSILVPTILHGFYDYCLFTGNILFILAFFIFLIMLYIFTIKKVNKVSSIVKKMKYKDNYCSNCGTPVNSNFCPGCGRKNE